MGKPELTQCAWRLALHDSQLYRILHAGKIPQQPNSAIKASKQWCFVPHLTPTLWWLQNALIASTSYLWLCPMNAHVHDIIYPGTACAGQSEQQWRWEDKGTATPPSRWAESLHHSGDDGVVRSLCISQSSNIPHGELFALFLFYQVLTEMIFPHHKCNVQFLAYSLQPYSTKGT